MTEIEAVVAEAAVRIDDLGKLGEKIGMIVGTIADPAPTAPRNQANGIRRAAPQGELVAVS